MRGAEILVVVGSLDVGGTERHLVRTLPALATARRRAAVAVIARRGPLADRLEEGGVPVIGPGRLEGRLTARWARPARVAAAAARILAAMVRTRPLAVHFYGPQAYWLGAPLALLAGVPTRIMSRRSLNLYMRGRPWIAAYERLLHAGTRAFVANSAAVAAELVQAEGVRPDRVRVIRNGVAAAPAPDPRARRDARLRLGADDAMVLVAVVANLIPYKGHADLLRAAAAMRTDAPWRIVCAGADPFGRLGELEALAQSLGVRDRVEFAGSVPDVAGLLQAADVGVLASHEEGFPNAVLEYMAAGLPVVATAVGGVAEAVAHGETGMVVPARSPEALRAALESLVDDPALRARLGRAGRARAEEEFSMEREAIGHERLYADLGLPS